MNPIIATLKEHNVSDEKVHELFQAFTQNPMMASTNGLGNDPASFNKRSR